MKQIDLSNESDPYIKTVSILVTSYQFGVASAKKQIVSLCETSQPIPNYPAALLLSMLASENEWELFMRVVDSVDKGPIKKSEILRYESMAYHIKGNKELAIKHSILALERDPENIDSQVQRAIILESYDTPSNAVAHLQRFLKINPKADLVHRIIGEILFADGNTAEGINYLKQAIKLSPNNADTHHSLGSLLLGPLYSMENIPPKNTLDLASKYLHTACVLTNWDNWEYL